MAGTETYGPFDSQPWADQTQWYRFGPTWTRSGVIDTPAASPSAGGLGLSFSGLTPTIAAGRAWVRGAGYELSGGSKTMAAIAANTNASLSRIDRIVLRRDLSAKTVTLVALQGTPSSTPTAPALTQNETGQWDVPLFAFTVPPNSGTVIATIIDERVWVNPGGEAPRGIVGGGHQTSTQSANSSTPVRVVGNTNQSKTCYTGRAYQVDWDSTAQTDTAGAVCAVNIYGAAGGTAGTSDVLLTSRGVPLDTPGGPGARGLAMHDCFTVASTGQKTVSAYMFRAAGSGTVTISGQIHLEIRDIGDASVLTGDYPVIP
jgi:hypothetical protein